LTDATLHVAQVHLDGLLFSLNLRRSLSHIRLPTP
jgi:hypothetical protein